MRLECWSCSPVRRKGYGRDWGVQSRPGRDCGRARCFLPTPDTAEWAENSDSGQGTFSQHTGKGTIGPEAAGSPEEPETDQDDTSAFGDSSVTSCSPDGTLRREDEEEEEEEDSQVPVLLRPSYSQQREGSRERSVCLRWQIPRVTPHPPLRGPAGPPCSEAAPPCPVSTYGKRMVSIRTGSPPLHPKSAFRPIWDDPSKQVMAMLRVHGLRLLSRSVTPFLLLSACPVASG